MKQKWLDKTAIDQLIGLILYFSHQLKTIDLILHTLCLHSLTLHLNPPLILPAAYASKSFNGIAATNFYHFMLIIINHGAKTIPLLLMVLCMHTCNQCCRWSFTEFLHQSIVANPSLAHTTVEAENMKYERLLHICSKGVIIIR